MRERLCLKADLSRRATCLDSTAGLHALLSLVVLSLAQNYSCRLLGLLCPSLASARGPRICTCPAQAFTEYRHRIGTSAVLFSARLSEPHIHWYVPLNSHPDNLLVSLCTRVTTLDRLRPLVHLRLPVHVATFISYHFTLHRPV